MKKAKYPELAGEMRKHGDTQKTLATLLKLPRASISRRLSGETEWSIGEIEKICRYYGKNYYELFKKGE